MAQVLWWPWNAALRPQNKMSSPGEVLWTTYARGVHPFEVEREEILIPEEFRKRQETVKWSLGFDDLTPSVWGKKKMKNEECSPPPTQKISNPISTWRFPVHVNGYLCKKKRFFCNGQKVFSFWPNVANFLEMSPSVRKTLKFIYNAVISSLRTNVKKVTSQNHGKKNVFPPKSKIKFSVLSGGHTQIAVHVHLSFPKYFSTPPLISFWASDRRFYSTVGISYS